MGSIAKIQMSLLVTLMRSGWILSGYNSLSVEDLARIAGIKTGTSIKTTTPNYFKKIWSNMAQPQHLSQAPIEVLPSVEALVPLKVMVADLSLTEMLAKTMEIEQLFKDAFIPTDRAAEYFKWLDELRIIKHCGRAIGARNVGKSRSSIHYREEDRARVSYVKAWSNSSSKRLFSQILKDIKHAAWKGKRHDLHSRLVGCLEPFGIEMLLIDNADNLQGEALIDLKQLHEDSGIPIVLLGGQAVDSSLENCDLLNSFPTLFDFDRLDHEDLLKTLKTIDIDILALPEASNLAEGIMFEALAYSSQARIGDLIKILTKAVLHSLKNGHGKVDERVLSNITNRYASRYIPPAARKKPELNSGQS